MNGGQGSNALARAFQQRIGEQKMAMAFDYGEIQENYSLLLNRFPHCIPKEDYMVCRSVTWGGVDDILYHTQVEGEENSGAHSHTEGLHGGHEGGDGGHSHEKNLGEEHLHDMLIGEKMRWLQPKDRVLVARVGDDFCVIDLIFPATVIGG
ncbi:MAG: hypothetical protein R3Y63_04190 [Eubacteriales bacterium]